MSCIPTPAVRWSGTGQRPDGVGRRRASYLDFTSGIGVNALGYCDPEWSAAVAAQAGQLQHTSNLYYTAPCTRVARKLCKRTGLDKVFFANSGAEATRAPSSAPANTASRPTAPPATRCSAWVNSFHGRTLATLTATGQDVFHHDFGPFPDHFAYLPANDSAALDTALQDETVCAVMMELVQAREASSPWMPTTSTMWRKSAPRRMFC